MPADEPPPEPSGGPAFAGTVRKLTLLNVTVTLLGGATGILQARALGPHGRGDLAAIVVPLYFVAFLGDIGLGLYARREAARTPALGRLVGTVGAVVVAVGVVGGVGLLPAVGLIARGRPVVHRWLSIGLLLLPVNLAGTFLMNVAFGLERWELWIRARLIVAVGWLVALVALYASGHLTVATAAASYVGLTLASYLPVLPLLRLARPLRFEPRLARQAIPFGSRAWLASLTNLANTRLDQLFMAGVVSSRELGLYAVAVTLAAFPSNFSGAVALGVLPRVARQGEELVPRTVRVALAVVVVVGAATALVAWPVIHFLAGHQFAGALPMIWLLLVAEVPLAGTITLGQSLIGAGRPGRTAAAEGLAVLVTIVGLVLLVRPLGGIGAALVSLAAYSVSFGYLLAASRSLLGRSIPSFIVPTRGDAAWGLSELRHLLRAVTRRGSSRLAG